jgi:hypothetical protein
VESLFRIRIVMKTGVGALSKVTRAFEHLGGTISSVDLQSGADEIGIVDLSVRLRQDVATVDIISDALRENKAGIVSELSPLDHAVDPVLRAIRWAANLVGAGSLADDELKRVIGEICSTRDAWFLSIEEAESIAVARPAAQRWAPVATSVSKVPPELEATFQGSAAVLAVPDARLEPTGIALIIRPAAQLFSITEIERVEAMLALRRRAALISAHPDVADDGSWFDVSQA